MEMKLLFQLPFLSLILSLPITLSSRSVLPFLLERHQNVTASDLFLGGNSWNKSIDRKPEKLATNISSENNSTSDQNFAPSFKKVRVDKHTRKRRFKRAKEVDKNENNAVVGEPETIYEWRYEEVKEDDLQFLQAANAAKSKLMLLILGFTLIPVFCFCGIFCVFCQENIGDWYKGCYVCICGCCDRMRGRDPGYRPFLIQFADIEIPPPSYEVYMKAKAFAENG